MEKFRSKYRIRTHRKPRWDYSAGALYFVTIVTQHRECNLGVIVNNEMQLSDFGNIVKHEWLKSFTIRSELILHQFAIMPNHLHAVFEICNIHRNNTTIGNGNDNGEDRRDTRPCVSTESRAIESSDNLMIKRNPPVRQSNGGAERPVLLGRARTLPADEGGVFAPQARRSGGGAGVYAVSR